MTTIREKALEAALQVAIVFDDRRKALSGGKPPTKGQWEVLMEHVRKALALPPSPDVNADMLAALQLAQSLTRANCPTPEFVTRVNMAVNAAIARATGQEG